MIHLVCRQFTLLWLIFDVVIVLHVAMQLLPA